MRGWKRLCAAAALLICIMAAVGGTLAWSTGGDRATNVVTTGAVEIRIVQGGAAQTVEYDPEWRGMLPGSAAVRSVFVETRRAGVDSREGADNDLQRGRAARFLPHAGRHAVGLL